MPKVSIIMSTYNNATYLKKSIQSVLHQSFSDFEFIIINDNSSDNTDEIIKNFKDKRIVYLKNNENKKLIHNLNKGLIIANGKFIARIDSDDYWIDSRKIEKQINFLERNMEYGLVGTWAKVYDKNNKEIFNIKHYLNFDDIKKTLLFKNHFVHSSVLFKKVSAVNNCCYLSEEKYVEDYGLWLRIGKEYKLANIPEYCVGYLLNEKGETQKNNSKQIKANLKLIKKYKNYYPNYFFAKLRWSFKYIIILFGGLKLINKIKSYK